MNFTDSESVCRCASVNNNYLIIYLYRIPRSIALMTQNQSVDVRYVHTSKISITNVLTMHYQEVLLALRTLYFHRLGNGVQMRDRKSVV